VLLTTGDKPFGRTLEDAKSVEASGIGGMYLRMGPVNVWRAHRAGMAVHPWTVDSTWIMRLMSRVWTDGYFTNHADRSLRVLGRSS
jgi:glycerophosphoryl diester phosphodiesterase